jgi:hypothetical protein
MATLQKHENKEKELAAWLDRLTWTAPWWILAVEGSGLVPGYVWWLVTGDAAAAKHIIRTWFPCSLAVLLFFCGAIVFCFPFYRPVERPSAAQRVGCVALGGFMWAVAVFAVTRGTLGLGPLAGARAGTAAFAAGFIVGLAVQRRLAAGERGEN